MGLGTRPVGVGRGVGLGTRPVAVEGALGPLPAGAAAAPSGS